MKKELRFVGTVAEFREWLAVFVCKHEWRWMITADAFWCSNCQATKDSDGGIIN